MMLEFLGWDHEASVLNSAVKAAVHANYLTADLGGKYSAIEVGDWLVNPPSIP